MRRLVTTFIAGTLSAIGFATPSASADDETQIESHVVWSEVHFDFDSAELSDTARAQLDKAAEWLAHNPDAAILIEGYADRAGPAAYNKRLAARRIEAARAYLAARGVDAAQIRVVAYGEAMTAVDTTKRERLNRRVVLTAVEKEPIIERQTVTSTERVEVPVERTVYVPKIVERERRVAAAREPLDIDVLAGGGVMDFIDSDTRDATGMAGTWSARVVGRPHHVLGYEAAYVGSAQGIDLFGANPDATLMGTGVEGDLRLNLLPRSPVTPYVFGGIGWTMYDVSHMEASTASMREDDDVFHVPAGLGVRVELPAQFILDLRGTYRAAFDDTMFDGLGGNNGLESWSAGGQLGLTF